MTTTEQSPHPLDADPHSALANTMAAYGIHDPTRLKELVELHERLKQEYKISFTEHGLSVKNARKLKLKGYPTKSTAMVDFMPVVNPNDSTVSKSSPQRGRTSAITVMGIRAFQDYVLLADSNLIERPELLYGITNPTMTSFSKRLGFEEAEGLRDLVVSDYDIIAGRVFSPECLELQAKLTQRLIAQSAVAGTLELQ